MARWRGIISAQNFVGDIDELKIFNRVLSLSEIITLTGSCSVTGIEEEFSNDNPLVIFPNPVDEQLNVRILKFGERELGGIAHRLRRHAGIA